MVLEGKRRVSELVLEEAKMAAKNSARLLETKHKKEMITLKRDAEKAKQDAS